MGKRTFPVLFLFLIFFSPRPFYAQDALAGTVPKKYNFSAEAGPEIFSGYTLYQIGGLVKLPDGSSSSTWFPLSELRFPLDVFMVSGDVRADYSDRFFLHGNIKKNINSYAGKMEDSDWGVFSGDPGSLEIYSTSDSDLDALIINTDFQVKVYTKSRFSLLAGAGFSYWNFRYVISDLVQTSVNPSYEGSVSGEVLTYKIDYYIPYLVVTPRFRVREKLSVWQSIALSPYVIARDVDDHILRYKESTGEARGASFMTSLSGEYSFNSHAFFRLALNYSYVYAEGWQSQYQYEEYDSVPVGPIADIQNKIESSQFSAVINGGIRF